MANIPKPSGPYHVGCTDVFTSYGSEGTFFRLFYPGKLNPDAKDSPWITDSEYVRGFMEFSGVGWLSWLANCLLGGIKVPAGLNDDFEMPSDVEKLPVVVFAHGLAGFRTSNTNICTELASHGMVVAAVEFDDQSASATYYYEKAASNEEQDVRRWVKFKPVPASDPNAFKIRNSQLYSRAKDCSAAMDCFTKMNSGSFSGIKDQIDFSKFEGKLDLSKSIILGHSFGGATTMATLARDKRFQAAACLDLWTFSLDEEIYENVPSSVPILIINTEKFQSEKSIGQIKRILAANDQSQSYMVTLLGSVHQSQADFSLTVDYGCLARRFQLRGTGDPVAIARAENNLILAFLASHLNLPFSKKPDDVIEDNKDIIIRGTNVILKTGDQNSS